MIKFYKTEDIERAFILLNATMEILNKCKDSSIILDPMCVTSVWDGVECDGHCLLEEISELIESTNE